MKKKILYSLYAIFIVAFLVSSVEPFVNKKPEIYLELYNLDSGNPIGIKTTCKNFNCKEVHFQILNMRNRVLVDSIISNYALNKTLRNGKIFYEELNKEFVPTGYYIFRVIAFEDLEKKDRAKKGIAYSKKVYINSYPYFNETFYRRI